MRICLYGGAGIGKSTLALWLTASMKEMGLNVEYIDEWIKQWAYEKRQIKGWDQYEVFSRQLHKEASKLQHGVDHVVTDSPLFMQIAYMNRNKAPYADICTQACHLFEEHFPALHILLLRGGFEYRQDGRWENYEQAVEMDEYVKTIMDKNLTDYLEFRAVDRERILSEIYIRMKGCC